MKNRSMKIQKQIQEIYNKVYKEVFNKSATKNLMEGERSDIEQRLIKLQGSNKYNEFAKKFAKELAKQGLSKERGVWRKYYEAAKRAHHIVLPATYKEFEFQILTKTVQHNFNMIKSIPERMMEILNHKYTSTLIEEVAKGTLPRGSFEKTLASHGNNQAKLIARTESAKLQTAITRTRATDLGTVAYEWISSKDKRTRPSHREMNGVIVFWRSSDLEKPLLDNMYGDAGEFPNCRCDAQPIIDEDDLTKSNYKVYNYKQHKIVNLSKKELLEALNKGSL